MSIVPGSNFGEDRVQAKNFLGWAWDKFGILEYE